MKIKSIGLTALAVFSLGAAAMPRPSEYIPELKHMPLRERPLLKAQDVVIEIPGIGRYEAGRQLQRTSLEGQWKFSGLETSELPFPAEAGSEISFAAENFNDSSWKPIKVPTNWWTVPEYSYSKVFRKSRKTMLKGQAYTHRYENPYAKGWYRHTIELPEKISGRVQLEFHAVGYEAELFVNGKSAGRHHGDFSTWIADITDYVKPGKNIIAMRILADMQAHDSRNKHAYGACWSDDNIKGGLWDHVFLRQDSSQYAIDRLLLDADSEGNLTLNYQICYDDERPLTVTPGVAVTLAEIGDAPAAAQEFPAVTLKKGVNSGTLKLKYPDPKLWDTEHPNLYFTTLYFRNGNSISALRVERFGFRDFRIKDNQFYLNGKPIFLCMETVQSMHFSGDRGNPYSRVTEFKKRGLNILRTAHQPVTPRVYDVADEVGMMIYDEWALAFSGEPHPEFFTRNPIEIEEFIMRDHNRPCVVMWLLGNEVKHSPGSGMNRAMKEQVKLVRKLDIQKRPVVSFAANGNVHSYGSDYIDTDAVDFHIYTGITRPWSQWDYEFQYMYEQAAKTFGKNGVINKPIIISEAIGGGWGLWAHGDVNFKHNDVDAYLAQLNKSFYWGWPGAAGYSGAIGVRAALDPKRNTRYTQNLIGSRIVEMARQDPRISAFGSWIAETQTKQYPRWFQPVYAGLRLSPEHRIPLHQLIAPHQYKLNTFLLNQSDQFLKNATVKVTLKTEENELPLAKAAFGDLQPGARVHKDIHFDIPALEAREGEIRLTVFANDEECGRNSYEVRIHPVFEITAPIEGAMPGLLTKSSPKLEALLRDLQIPYEVLGNGTDFQKFKWILLVPGSKLSPAAEYALRQHVENGAILASLEQLNGKFAVVPEYFATGDQNTMVEMVIMNHPLFEGLDDADLDVWGENVSGNVITRTILPLNPTLLAAKGRFLLEPTAGSAVVEAKIGNGRIVASQLDAVNLWKVNGAATRFLRNFMKYVSTQEKLYADVRELERTPIKNYAIAHERIQPVALGNAAKPLTSPKLTPGRTEAGGIPFQLSGNAVQTGGCQQITISVELKASKLIFLHTAVNAPANRLIATLRVNYEKGSPQFIKIVSGVNIGDCTAPAPLPAALPGLISRTDDSKRTGFFVTEWENPTPGNLIKSITVIAKAPESLYALGGITAELPHQAPLPLMDVANPEHTWWCTADNGGAVGSCKQTRTGNDKIGKFAHMIHFPAGKNGGIPVALTGMKIDQAKFLDNNYDYISFDYRSNSKGVIDFVLPQKSHAARWIYNIDLGKSKGKWIHVRLNLKRDFKLEGSDFEVHDLRKEIILYNGYDKTAGYPRPEAKLEITNLRLE